MQKNHAGLKTMAIIALAIAAMIAVTYDAKAADSKSPASAADIPPTGTQENARTLTDDAKTQLLGVILPGRKIEIIVIKGDDEAYLYASQVMDFLKANKREIANGDIVTKDFDVPPVPQKIFIGKTYYEIVIGHNTQK